MRAVAARQRNCGRRLRQPASRRPGVRSRRCVPTLPPVDPARHGTDAWRVLGSGRAGRRLRGRRRLRIPAHRAAVEIRWGRGLSGQPDSDQIVQIQRKTMLVDGLATGYLEAGEGDPVVLLHGGEFGASAELGWERNIAALAERYRVLAPDQLGYGHLAKVIDFVDGRGMRIRHVARFCEVLGIESAHFVGNSMGAINLLTDATSEAPLFRVRSLGIICGGGEIQLNQYFDALQHYDATLPAMRRIVEALFHDPSYPADDDYVRRRYESSTAPGAWEAIAAARFRRPGATQSATPSSGRAYERIGVPTIVVEGGDDKLLPTGWATQVAKQIDGARSAVVDKAGHCPQIEQSSVVNEMLLDFLATV